MRIGIDLTFIRPDHKNGGTESALKNLIKGIENICHLPKYQQMEFVYFIHRDIYDDYKKMFPNLHYHVYDMKGTHPLRMVLFQTFFLPGLAKKEKLDIMYFPTFQTGLKKNWPVKLMINPNDIQYKYYPEYFSRAKRKYYDIFYKNSLKKASALIAISHYVKSSYEQFFQKEIADKMFVIYAPIDFSKKTCEVVESVKNEKGRFILCINSLTKHKNLITLLKAFEALDLDGQKLVIGGAAWNGANEIQEFISAHRMEDKVILTGRLTDAQLQYLYQNAKLFVTPSLYEGFGMTPIEAMAAECPVISSKETSLYEVTQGLVNYYEPATDADRLADVMKTTLQKIDHGEITKAHLQDLHRRVYDSYNTDAIARQYLELFAQQCGK